MTGFEKMRDSNADGLGRALVQTDRRVAQAGEKARRPLMKVLRIAVVTTATLLLSFAVGRAALAQIGTCSSTMLHPGDVITVTGSGAVAGDPITLDFNFSVIGATTSDGFGNFTVSGPVPSGTVPGVYSVDFFDNGAGPDHACNVTVQPAATAPPAPVPTAAPAPTPVQTPITIIKEVPAPPAPAPLQQQQQQQVVLAAPVVQTLPVALLQTQRQSPSSAGLPATGVDVAKLGGTGIASLLLGLFMVLFARRRGQRWFALDGVLSRRDESVTWTEADILSC